MDTSSSPSVQPPYQNVDVEEVYELRAEVKRLKEEIHLLKSRFKSNAEHDGMTDVDVVSSEQRSLNHHQQRQQLNDDTSIHAEYDTNDIDNHSESRSPKSTIDIPQAPSMVNNKLTPNQISRYSRQLLLSDGFGTAGQRKLLSSKVLVVGAGGIGSSLLLYLAASGLGHVTIVDYDVVERSNLHRQIIHCDHDAVDGGVTFNNVKTRMNKAQSAKEAMLRLNPTISITALDTCLNSSNITSLVKEHDVIVDASDNPATRYLINDACILCNVPLVSGSAMGTEGQLTVYNYNPIQDDSNHDDFDNNIFNNNTNGGCKKSACYRCLYPNPNPMEGCKSCSDNGVLGPVPGLIGVLQAVEVIKIITGIGKVMHDRLLMYDSLPCSFINLKKPPPKSNCAVCSSQATITSIQDSELSLQNTRGPAVSSCSIPVPSTAILSKEQRISCQDYNQLRLENKPHVLLDVRIPRQYEMCSLDGSVNIPLEELSSKLDVIEQLSHGEIPVYCLCRRGVASVEATRILQQSKDGNMNDSKIHSVFNIDGGLNEWVKSVDDQFPWY